MFREFGNPRSKAIGVFDTELTIQAEVYRSEVYVVSVEVMDVKMLLGKDLHKQMDIRILGKQTRIRKIATKISNDISTYKADDEECLQNDQK